MSEHKEHDEKKDVKKPAPKKAAKKTAPKKKEEEHIVQDTKSPEHKHGAAHEHKHVEAKPPEHKPAEQKPAEHKHAEHKPEPVVQKPVEPKPEKKAPRKATKKGEKVIVVRGKRKESVARATIQKGRGMIRVNKINVDALSNKYVRDMIREPLKFVGPEVNSVDISVTVVGGGLMGQAQAARTAIANAIVEYFDGDKTIYDRMFAYDKFMVVEDSRRVEPKKYKGPKARARFQKSYR
jgi:small subunit ribosomal protein S9